MCVLCARKPKETPLKFSPEGRPTHQPSKQNTTSCGRPAKLFNRTLQTQHFLKEHGKIAKADVHGEAGEGLAAVKVHGTGEPLILTEEERRQKFV